MRRVVRAWESLPDTPGDSVRRLASRDDVDARSLANSYAQMLGTIFTHEMKPMEVEILVAEVGLEPAGDQMFHILYDGSVSDERDLVVLGGEADAIRDRLAETFEASADLAGALRSGGYAILSGILNEQAVHAMFDLRSETSTNDTGAGSSTTGCVASGVESLNLPRGFRLDRTTL